MELLEEGKYFDQHVTIWVEFSLTDTCSRWINSIYLLLLQILDIAHAKHTKITFNLASGRKVLCGVKRVTSCAAEIFILLLNMTTKVKKDKF